MKVKSKKELKSNKNNFQGFPKPKKTKCFKCETKFFIKFVISRQDYSKKNNWDYWTGEEKDFKICNGCLKKFYYDKPVYWATIKDLKKRNLLKSYIHDGHLD